MKSCIDGSLVVNNNKNKLKILPLYSVLYLIKNWFLDEIYYTEEIYENTGY